MGYLDQIREVERKMLQAVPATDWQSDADWWRAAWQEVAALAIPVTDGDPRLEPVRAALKQCGDAFDAGDRQAFQRAMETVRLAESWPKAGCRIWWAGSRANVPLEGPGVVLGAFIDTATGEPWCWFTYRGYDHIKLCRTVSRWEPPATEQGGPVAV